MAVCKFCGIPFSSVSSVCDHLELYHDDSHDTCPGKDSLLQFDGNSEAFFHHSR